MSEQASIVAAQPQKLTVRLGKQGFEPQSFDELYRVASALYRSGQIPKGYTSVEQVFISMSRAYEVGVPLMQACEAFTNFGGKCAIWGDHALGVVMASGKLTGKKETFEGKIGEDSFTAICEMEREGKFSTVSRFSWADAKRAGLAGKDMYRNYPARMLLWRARSYAMRDLFADLLKGIAIAEELQDAGLQQTAPLSLPDAPKPMADLKAAAMSAGFQVVKETAIEPTPIVEPVVIEYNPEDMRVELPVEATVTDAKPVEPEPEPTQPAKFEPPAPVAPAAPPADSIFGKLPPAPATTGLPDAQPPAKPVKAKTPPETSHQKIDRLEAKVDRDGYDPQKFVDAMGQYMTFFKVDDVAKFTPDNMRIIEQDYTLKGGYFA